MAWRLSFVNRISLAALQFQCDERCKKNQTVSEGVPFCQVHLVLSFHTSCRQTVTTTTEKHTHKPHMWLSKRPRTTPGVRRCEISLCLMYLSVFWPCSYNHVWTLCTADHRRLPRTIEHRRDDDELNQRKLRQIKILGKKEKQNDWCFWLNNQTSETSETSKWQWLNTHSRIKIRQGRGKLCVHEVLDTLETS